MRRAKLAVVAEAGVMVSFSACILVIAFYSEAWNGILIGSAIALVLSSCLLMAVGDPSLHPASAKKQ
jgi:hypothetical protein